MILTGRAVERHHCSECKTKTRCEYVRAGIGFLDIFLMAVTCGLWIIPAIIGCLNNSAWRCTVCGSRVK